MTKWIKKIHIYLGLLNFTILIIFGIVGLATSFLPPPNQRQKAEPKVRYVNYTAPSNLDDRALADHAYKALNLPVTKPTPNWSLRRDSENNLRFRLPTLNRVHNIVVLEEKSQLRVTTQTLDTWDFLFRLHELTMHHAAPDWKTQLWAIYIELSIWSLMLMSIGGVYLWLASRPKLRWAQMSFAAGLISFIALWTLTR
jgi:hypothetical protein